MAKFHAKGSFKIDRNGLRTVIFGDIVDGTIRHGMKIHIRFNDSLSMTSEIEAVESIVYRPDGRRVVLGTRKGEIAFVDTADGRVGDRFNFGTGAVFALAYSPVSVHRPCFFILMGSSNSRISRPS